MKNDLESELNEKKKLKIIIPHTFKQRLIVVLCDLQQAGYGPRRLASASKGIKTCNQLPDSFRQPNHSCLDSPPHPLFNPSLSSSHSRHRSLLLSFTPGSKPTFSTNPSHLRFLLPTGLPHDNGTGLDLLRSSFYF